MDLGQQDDVTMSHKIHRNRKALRVGCTLVCDLHIDIYATPAAGGIIYSLNVIFFFFLARPYGLTFANIFIPSSQGGQKLLEH